VNQGPALLGERFDRALVYAAQIHAAQVRKGNNVPYISHLMAASSLVLEHGGNEDEAIAALLHDAAEDQGGEPRLDDIRHRFGEAVADIVRGCSDSLVVDPAMKEEWHARKRRYIKHLASASPSVRLVSCADKLHNARCTLADLRRDGAGATYGKFNSNADDHLWYYDSLVNAFKEHGPAELAQELERTVARMKELSGADQASNASSAPPASG
jgi:GTP pyrophosphokinase